MEKIELKNSIKHQLSTDACSWILPMVLLSSATSSNPWASNHGALAQSNPSPKVLSGATTYQWQSTSGASTEHFDQSFCHWGTWTHITAAKTRVKRLCSMNLSFSNISGNHSNRKFDSSAPENLRPGLIGEAIRLLSRLISRGPIQARGEGQRSDVSTTIGAF